jgi:hypothetical protein
MVLKCDIFYLHPSYYKVLIDQRQRELLMVYIFSCFHITFILMIEVVDTRARKRARKKDGDCQVSKATSVIKSHTITIKTFTHTQQNIIQQYSSFIFYLYPCGPVFWAKKYTTQVQVMLCFSFQSL